MTREGFIEILDREDYSYEVKGDKIVVTYKGWVYLESLTSLPPGVVFKNKGDVDLESLTSLPSGVEFKNGGGVDLRALTSLPPGVEFKNGGFKHGFGIVNLASLTGGFFDEWNGNIEDIDSKMLLNKMIKDGVFER